MHYYKLCRSALALKLTLLFRKKKAKDAEAPEKVDDRVVGK